MYALLDTFNDRIISRHRTIEAAQKKDAAYQRAVKRANGQGSYVPTVIREVIKGELVKIEGYPFCDCD